MSAPPEPIPLLQIHQSYQPDLIRLFGIIAIETSWLDLSVGKALAIKTGQDLDLAYNPMFATNTRPKVEKLLKLELEPWLRDAVQQIPEILAERNLLLHGVCFTLTAPNQMIGLRGKFENKPQDVTPERAQALLKKIAFVNGALQLVSKAAGLTMPFGETH